MNKVRATYKRSLTKDDRVAFVITKDNKIQLPPKPDRIPANQIWTEEYIAARLKPFNEKGCGVLVVKEWTIGNPNYHTWPARKFVGEVDIMRSIMTQYKEVKNTGDIEAWKILRDKLNLGKDADLSKNNLYYIEIGPKDKRFKYELPTGSEGGAYDEEWVPAGLTKDDTPEVKEIKE